MVLQRRENLLGRALPVPGPGVQRTDDAVEQADVKLLAEVEQLGGRVRGARHHASGVNARSQTLSLGKTASR